MRARTIIGIVLIMFGAILLLEQFTLHYSILGMWWPTVIIVAGLAYLTKQPRSIFWGLNIVAIGILMQANKLDLLPYGFWGSYWPVLLIMAGVAVLTKRWHHHKFHKGMERSINNNDFIEIMNIFSGSEQTVDVDGFKGGTINVFFGGSEIDLRKATLSPEGAILDLTCAFGGMEVIVPQGWRIASSGFPFLGGFDDKTVQTIDTSAPVLKINYFVMFGGIELKNRKKREF